MPRGLARFQSFGPPGDSHVYQHPEEFDALEKAWADYIGTTYVPERQSSEPTRDVDPEPDPERKRLHAEAVEYIRTYSGRFGLILDLRADPRWGTKWHRLTDRQVAAVLKCRDNEARWAAERAATPRPETGRDLNVLPYGRTLAAVDNDSGGLTFLILDRPGELDRWHQPSKWHGWVFVKQQQGPNEVKLGSQRPGGTYVGQWANLIDKVLADPMAAVIRYGRELGVCGVCGLPLTNAESREVGIGPVCRTRIAA